MLFKITIAKRSIHRQDFTVTDMAHRSRLRDLMSMNSQCDINVHDFTGLRIRQILRSCPYGLSARGPLHRSDRGTEAATAKQEAPTGTNALHNRQDPPMRIVSGLQSQELSAIHRLKL
jgi:hypothetical protein